MKIAYLVMAHANPDHFHRLVRAIQADFAYIFAHIDLKSDISKFRALDRKRVTYIRHRYPVYWGDYSLVNATLQGIKTILDDKPDVQTVVLLSGADYPLKSNEAIYDFFEKNRGREFMECRQLPAPEIGKPMERFLEFKPTAPYDSVHLVKRGLAVARKFVPQMTRRNYKSYLGEIVPHGGATWWSLSRTACEYVAELIENNPQIESYFKHVMIPDEFFFQTLLSNSPFKASIVDRCLTFTSWESAASNHPSTISQTHLPYLREQQSYLFARKFDGTDHELLDEIERIRRQPSSNLL